MSLALEIYISECLLFLVYVCNALKINLFKAIYLKINFNLTCVFNDKCYINETLCSMEISVCLHM